MDQLFHFAKKLRPAEWALLLLCALVVAALKLHTDYAPVNQLKWILSPVTFFVQLQSGIPFFFDAAQGYVSADGSMVIGRNCAGSSFMIIAWLMAFSMYWSSKKTTGERTVLFFSSLLAAWLVTLPANSFRIIAAILLLGWRGEAPWLANHYVHEGLGVLVYFSFLLLYFFLLRRRLKSKTAYENAA